jgi:signal transduction histidine kinase
LSRLAAKEPKEIAFLEEPDIGDLRLLPDARSCVLVPIRTDARMLAFLLIESRATGHFSADQQLLEVLAAQAAVSINRVQLLRDRERTERGLQVSANAIAVGQIATTFLHEAKNSLSGISLTAQSLHEDIEREPDLKAKKDYIDRLVAIQEEVDRFDTLSRRLQRFTQQGLTPQKREVYLNPIVQQTLVLMGSALRSKGMKKEVKLDSTLDAPSGKGKGKGHPIFADEDQIQQVLMNLILNAVAASGERRPLVVETRNFGDHAEIRVTDQGTGIQSEVKGSLFKPFFTTKKDGVGLGLFLSRILVEDNHGGSIDVSSSPGKGSTFTIRLPKSQ